MGAEQQDRSPQDGATPTCGLAALLHRSTTRRKLLSVTALGGAGMYVAAHLPTQEFVVSPVLAETLAQATPTSADRQLYQSEPLGMIIADPTRCVGCRRCELACTEFNDGKAQPSIARVKVGRNYNFGLEPAMLGYSREEGRWGNHLLIQETCRQCPHPVPCQTACPYGAIESRPSLYARVVNPDKCQGCRTCQQACPWDMISFDEELEQATKCTLCNGKPECVQACPAGALRYVPWRDMTRVVPGRHVVPGYVAVPVGLQESCDRCH